MGKFKFYGALGMFVLYLLFFGYMGYENFKHPNPQLIQLVKTPVSWIDVGMGFIAGAVVVMMAMLFAISWPIKKYGEPNPGGGGDGPKRKIILPVLGKVISIEEFKKLPPHGPVQMVKTGT